MSLDGLNTLMRMLQRKVRMCEITDNEKVFEDHLTHVLHEYFGIRMPCSMWVLRLLTIDQKQLPVDYLEQCLELFKAD